MAELRLQLVAAVLALASVSNFCGGFEFHEATVDSIQLGFTNGSLTSTALVRFYLDQISRLNPLLHAVIEVNPDALAQAARADAERSSGRCPNGGGGLHGVPVLLKDNIATRDRLNTTAGSLALLGSVVKRDAGVASRLRRAGAVVLGKANPSEWSNFRPVNNGWSARGGQSLNPYVLSVTPCGSSAGPGIAAAANMAAVTLGTETDGSILCPSSSNSVVGIKPTVGLTSRSGVIPITPRQDTVGPMCRTVSDAVHVLDAIVGYDPLDAAATGAASKYIPPGGYKQFLRVDGLRGKRIGIPTGFFDSYGKMEQRVYREHVATMRVQAKPERLFVRLALLPSPLPCGSHSIQQRTSCRGEAKRFWAARPHRGRKYQWHWLPGESRDPKIPMALTVRQWAGEADEGTPVGCNCDAQLRRFLCSRHRRLPRHRRAGWVRQAGSPLRDMLRWAEGLRAKAD